MRQLFRTSVYTLLMILALVAGSTLSAQAVEPDEILSDPVLVGRARALSAELRCLVCQNQSIDDSNAPLARDLRLLVRERLKAGDDDVEIMDYIVARYGEFVLLRPRFSAATLVLWLSPLLILAVGIWLARSVMRGRNATTAPVEALSDEDQQKLAAILEDSSRRD